MAQKARPAQQSSCLGAGESWGKLHHKRSLRRPQIFSLWKKKKKKRRRVIFFSCYFFFMHLNFTSGVCAPLFVSLSWADTRLQAPRLWYCHHDCTGSGIGHGGTESEGDSWTVSVAGPKAWCLSPLFSAAFSLCLFLAHEFHSDPLPASFLLA